MDGVFLIHPMTSPAPVRVRCTMKWGGKTTILLHDTNNPYVNFSRDWSDYKIGFGSVEDGSNFYIGNDAIHLITANRKQRMVIDVGFSSFYRQFFYTGVQVAHENENYRLTYEGKFGHKDYPLGDCFPGNDILFSTIDRDNDADPGSCAQTHMSGWWFDACGPCNPTGKLQAKSETHQNGDPTWLHVIGAENEAVRHLNVGLYFKP